MFNNDDHTYDYRQVTVNSNGHSFNFKQVKNNSTDSAITIILLRMFVITCVDSIQSNFPLIRKLTLGLQ